MPELPIYLDNHATTRVDPRVIEAMLPYFGQIYGNAGSVGHGFGWEAKAAVDSARATIAAGIGGSEREIIFTSGATESCNLAIRGVVESSRRRGNHLVSVATEHKAVLDPLQKLARRGFEVTLLPVRPAGNDDSGLLDIELLKQSLRADTALVSVMLANNEIGVVQPIAQIGAICRERGIPLHCDATQAVGKLAIDVEQLQVDLLSFSAHKFYGPKGIGGLFVRRRGSGLRLESQIDGGGQEFGLRSGTANVPSIVGMAAALQLCLDELESEQLHAQSLRNRLWAGLQRELPETLLNGPTFDSAGDSSSPLRRLPGNLNCSFPLVDGEALLLSMKEIAVSSGSACTSANPEPSHVLRALGQSDEMCRASLRFGIGRFNTADEIDYAVAAVAANVRKLRSLSSLA